MENRIISNIKKNEFLFHVVRSISLCFISFSGIFTRKKFVEDHLKSTFSFIIKSNINLGLPINITIEPANFCNLKCEVCETGADVLGRKKELMSLDTFKKIIDKIKGHVNTLMFYYMGEPFMVKDSYEMINYAKLQGVPFITACTNGDLVNPEKLLKSGIDEVNFQIGGLLQETHSTYRNGSKIDVVLENLKEVVRLRNQHHSNMKINCGFIVMKHNLSEVGDFKKLMSGIGVDSYDVISPAFRNTEQAVRLLPENRAYWLYDEDYLKMNILKPIITAKNSCPWIYYSVVILVNGDVVPCCRDVHGMFKMGNILEESLVDIWNNEKNILFRKQINSKARNPEICKLCSSYGGSRLK